MPVYMRFEEERHVETTTLNKKPEGDQWYKAPTEFEWGKRYGLIDGKITEQSAEAIANAALITARVQALHTIKMMLDAKRKQYVGYSPEKTQAYAVQAEVADQILTQQDTETYTQLIEPLAKLRGLTAIDMAKLIQGKAQGAAKALLQCELLEDQAKQAITNATTVEQITTFIQAFSNTVGDV